MASVFNSTADYILTSRRGRGEPNVTFTGPPFVYEILVKNIVQYHPLVEVTPVDVLCLLTVFRIVS